MIAFDAMEPAHMAFLYELYTRSAGDARQGVPYEALIDALGFEERVTKRIQRALEREGLVDLTTVPPMTHMGQTASEQTLLSKSISSTRRLASSLNRMPVCRKVIIMA